MFKVTVVIPVYNGASFLEATIKSVLVHPQVAECLLIEDGSTDTSLEICTRWAQQDHRIKLLRHSLGANKGCAISKNLGIEAATSPYIAFLDQDDHFLPNKWQVAEQLYAKNELGDGICEPVMVKNRLDNSQKLFGILRPLQEKALFSYMVRGGYFHTAGLIVRKQLLQQAGGFDQSLWPHDDSGLWIKLTWLGHLKAITTGGAVADYYLHDTNNIYQANYTTQWRLWRKLNAYFLFKAVGLSNHLWLFRRLLKYGWLSLKIKLSVH
jgi:glycosyltransferase involved in cell wall biosynthesis